MEGKKKDKVFSDLVNYIIEYLGCRFVLNRFDVQNMVYGHYINYNYPNIKIYEGLVIDP